MTRDGVTREGYSSRNHASRNHALMKRLLLPICLALLAAAPAHAQYAGAFARFGFGARAISMGGALTADVFGDASPYHNPALAPDVAQQALDASAAVMTFDRQLQHLQFVAPLRPRAGVAGGVVHGAVTDIDGRDASGYHTEDYRTDEYAFFVAFGARFSSRLAGGVGLRLYRADYFEGVRAPTSLGLSLGFTLRPSDNLAFAFAADDLLARYAWDTSELLGESAQSVTDRFPTRLRAGAAYRVFGGRGALTAEVEAQVETAEFREVTGIGTTAGVPTVEVTETELRLSTVLARVGGELWLADPFAVRFGYDRLGAGDVGEAMPSGGFALKQRFGDLDARLDYAAVLEPYAAGTMHVVTLHLGL
jgi:hypothetical protein